jgi:large subunit ribosomal protein L24
VKHVKPSNDDTEGGIKPIPAKLNASNVAVLDPKSKDTVTRVGFEVKDGKKVRIARKSKHQLKK